MRYLKTRIAEVLMVALFFGYAVFVLWVTSSPIKKSEAETVADQEVLRLRYWPSHPPKELVAHPQQDNCY